MVKDRFICVEYNKVLNVIQDKESLDALCMAIFLKAKFTNSILYKHSARDMKKLCGLGTERIKRCLSKGKQLGYFTETERGLKIEKLHSRKSRYRFFLFSCDTDFRSIQNKLRKELLLNKAGQLAWLRNQVDKGTCEYAKLKDIRKYKKVREKMALRTEESDTIGSLRKVRIAEYLNCSKSKVNTLLRELKKEDRIIVEPCYVDVAMQLDIMNLAQSNEYLPDVNTHHNGGFLCKHYNRLSIQIGNFYAPKYAI